jgi:hypothetical protein
MENGEWGMGNGSLRMGEWFIHIDGEWTFEKQSIILKKSSIKINVLFPIPHSLFPIPQKALHQMKVILINTRGDFFYGNASLGYGFWWDWGADSHLS